MEQHLPRNNRVHFEDPNKLHSFTLTIVPDDGYWQGGRFKFHLDVPEEYNIVVSGIGAPFSRLSLRVLEAGLCFTYQLNFVCPSASKSQMQYTYMASEYQWGWGSVLIAPKRKLSWYNGWDTCFHFYSIPFLSSSIIQFVETHLQLFLFLSSGWAPTRKLKDVVWGLNSLFSVSTSSVLLNLMMSCFDW